MFRASAAPVPSVPTLFGFEGSIGLAPTWTWTGTRGGSGTAVVRGRDPQTQRLMLTLTGEGEADARIQLGEGDAQFQLEVRSLGGGFDKQKRQNTTDAGESEYMIF
mmetsp:Transcript_6370/g.13350  ORF Transcript_6370/g.13350 Transcript_6370/m.13350 type:complete len:106 (-) Transcript_6370:9-326(-)